MVYFILAVVYTAVFFTDFWRNRKSLNKAGRLIYCLLLTAGFAISLLTASGITLPNPLISLTRFIDGIV